MSNTTIATTNAKTPSTPQQQPSSPALTSTPSPAQWRHPNFNEIVKRQRAATFDGDNVKTIIINFLALLAFFPLADMSSYLPGFITANAIAHLLAPYFPYLRWLLRFVLLYNIYRATRPLYNKADNLKDIPLTPTQRKLLGLDPNSTPPLQSGKSYITPPKYSRTPSSSGSRTSASPLSRRASPLGTGRHSNFGTGEGYSPSGSPLWQRTISGNHARRSSLGMSGQSPFGDSTYVPMTPSPSNKVAGGIPLSSRWLYERTK